MDTGNYLQIMIDSLTKKEVLLKQIVGYNEEQQAIVTAVEFDDAAFQQNLDKKGVLVEEILKLDEGFNSVFARVKEELQEHKAEWSEELARLKQLVKSVTDLGVRIQAQELRNKQLVEKCFAEMRKNLSNAKMATSKANAYYKNANHISEYDSHFLDKKK